jgi:hypothetical protein
MAGRRHTGRRSSLEQQRRVRRRRRVVVGIIAAGLVTVMAAVLLGADDETDANGITDRSATWDATPFAGGARLAVDQQVIDHGDVPYNHTVEAEFRLKNVGDQTLVIDQPRIEILEGC